MRLAIVEGQTTAGKSKPARPFPDSNHRVNSHLLSDAFVNPTVSSRSRPRHRVVGQRGWFISGVLAWSDGDEILARSLVRFAAIRHPAHLPRRKPVPIPSGHNDRNIARLVLSGQCLEFIRLDSYPIHRRYRFGATSRATNWDREALVASVAFVFDTCGLAWHRRVSGVAKVLANQRLWFSLNVHHLNPSPHRGSVYGLLGQ